VSRCIAKFINLTKLKRSIYFGTEEVPYNINARTRPTHGIFLESFSLAASDPQSNDYVCDVLVYYSFIQAYE
jgi:hypothetical protein